MVMYYVDSYVLQMARLMGYLAFPLSNALSEFAMRDIDWWTDFDTPDVAIV